MFPARTRRVVFGSVLLCCCLSSPRAGDWLTSYADIGRSGRLSTEDLAPPFSVAWTVTVPGTLKEAPLVVRDDVYLITRSFSVYALTAPTGSRRWAFTGPSLPAEAVNFDPRDGSIRWRRRLDATVVHTHQAGFGIMLVGTERGTLYGLSQDDGHEYWHVALTPPLSLAATDHTEAVIGSADRLVGIDLSTGASRYATALPPPLRFFPVLGREGAYVAAGSALLALDHAGRIRWRAALGKPATAPPALTADGVLVATADGLVRSFSRSRGTSTWEYLLAGTGREVCVAGDRAYIGSHQGRVLCLDAASGAALWTVDGSDRTRAPIEGLAPARGRLLVSTGGIARSLLPAPEPPADVLVRREGPSDALHWTPSAPNASPISGYLVWRASGETWTQVGVTGPSVTAWPLPAAMPGRDLFALTAVAENGSHSSMSRSAGRDTPEPLLTNLVVAPRPFHPGGTPLQASFHLREAARVTWRIADLERRPVTDDRLELQPRGPGAITWDGRDRTGRFVPPGTWTLVIAAEAAADRDEQARAIGIGPEDATPPAGGLTGPGSGNRPADETPGGGTGSTGATGAAGEHDRHGNNGVRDHGVGEGRDGAGQGRGRGQGPDAGR